MRRAVVLAAIVGLVMQGSALAHTPLGQDCLLNNQAACDFTNTISQPVFYPGTYYLAMWNPNGVPTDYTANIGFIETGEEGTPEVNDMIRDNGLLHRSCHEPYPFR